uniref:Uncharacterized protein n=1 Tax=Aegilops tauschii subsp. strangulata TaxID=200361 RepID=A0A453N4K6_AEGTS
MLTIEDGGPWSSSDAPGGDLHLELQRFDDLQLHVLLPFISMCFYLLRAPIV